MSPAMQLRLLRVLQEGEVRRLGAPGVRKVNVRVIAATNADLEADVDAGRFRRDLYYRLNVFPIPLPPLRERTEDIPVLAETFLRPACRRARRAVPSISPEAMALLQAYPFPGNVRELENEIERAVALAEDGRPIGPEHLSDRMRAARGHVAARHARRGDRAAQATNDRGRAPGLRHRRRARPSASGSAGKASSKC